MKLLEIQSSARQQGSISRLLSQEFIETWKNHHPKIDCKQRVVGNKPPAYISELWTKANYLQPEPQSIFSFSFVKHEIQTIFAIVNPDKLKVSELKYTHFN